MKFTRFAIPAALLAGALALTGCGQKPDDGIATANGNGVQPAANEVSSDPKERMRQFAQCMRDQGIDMPDPEFIEGEGGGGGFALKAEAGVATDAAPADQANPREDMGKFKEAIQACQKYQPQGGEMGKIDPEMEAKMREFAKCMRENGVEDFPDPEEGGGIRIMGGEGGIDPSDPTFQAAQEKCGANMPKMRAGAVTTP